MKNGSSEHSKVLAGRGGQALGDAELTRFKNKRKTLWAGKLGD